jgi:hypothetical protein
MGGAVKTLMGGGAKPTVVKPEPVRMIDQNAPELEKAKRRRMDIERGMKGRESTRLSDTKAAYSGGVLGD